MHDSANVINMVQTPDGLSWKLLECLVFAKGHSLCRSAWKH
jgi:hypothetical protein